jgi:uncharacterized protein
MKRAGWLCVMALVCGLAGCKDDKSSNPPQPKTEVAMAAQPQASPEARPSAEAATTAPAASAPKTATLANPASVNCGKQDGKTVIRKDPKSGGEVGYCVFTDGSECEEWALMRGTCKAGPQSKAKP